ncbi:MAG: exosortase A [Sphingomonadales bacterium]|nr:exosortase A [Sphingomonadales bacterium]
MTAEAQTAAIKERHWYVAGALWLAAIVAIVAMFADTAASMMDTWHNSATYNHCFLIPLIAAYLTWERREIFQRTAPRPQLLGLLLVAAAGFLWLLGRLVGVLMVEEFALVFALQGATLAIVGWTVARALILPIGFLLFMVPFGDFLVQPLQNLTADFVVWFLRLIGVPVFRDGVFLSTPSGEFHVAEACSGVRFLIAMIPLGVLLADMAFKSWWRRLAVVALSFAVPIVANGIRAFGIVYIAYLTDNEYATGVDHIVYGWIFFSIVTLALIFIGMSFSDKPIDAPAIDFSWVIPSSATPPAKLGVITLLIAGLSAPWPWLATRAMTIAPAPLAALAAPEAAGPWRLLTEVTAPSWTPRYDGVSDELVARYQRTDGAEVTLYYGYYAIQGDAGELIQFGNGIDPGRWSWSASRDRAITLANADVKARESEISAVGEARRVWHWYWIGGHLTSNDYLAKAWHLWARLSHGSDAAAVVAFSTHEGYRAEEAPAVLADFLAHVRADLPGFRTIGAK